MLEGIESFLQRIKPFIDCNRILSLIGARIGAQVISRRLERNEQPFLFSIFGESLIR